VGRCADSFTDARTGVRHDGTCGAPQQCCGHFVGVFPAAIAYASWSVVLASFPLGRAAGFLYLIPPCAMLFSYLWLREVPGKASLIGGVLALSGVILLNRFGHAHVKETS
jgi:drug/metabolite transporter (DMT)-like permease